MNFRERTIAILDFLRGRKRDYQHTFMSPAGQRTLQDLMVFCRANETTFHDDARKHAVLEGRREVYLRIQSHLNLTTEQLFDLYAGRTMQQQQEEK